MATQYIFVLNLFIIASSLIITNGFGLISITRWNNAKYYTISKSQHSLHYNAPPTTTRTRHRTLLLTSKKDADPSKESSTEKEKERRRKREIFLKFAKSVVTKPISAAPMPRAIAMVLRDAAEGAVEEVFVPALEEATSKKKKRGDDPFATAKKETERAFAAAEAAVEQAEVALEALQEVKKALKEARREASAAIREAEVAAAGAAAGAAAAATAAAAISSVVEPSVLTDITDLSIEDIDFSLSEMAPPFIGEDQCLVPGEPIVRVEKAPENSRRIFAGIDIMATVDDVWEVLTDYQNLQNVVPNLVTNEVLQLYPPTSTSPPPSSSSDEEQCRHLSQAMKGAKLRQVGGAKVVGINFSARTTLEVREWPQGLPDFAHFEEEVFQGKSRNKRASEGKNLPLKRYRFPRPFAISSLPTKDISMQSIANDDGEFRMYQGVWRMQPLPGCAPEGMAAMRLTYAVEISPRAYLPVSLVEGRITKDLCNNLQAIRDYVGQR